MTTVDIRDVGAKVHAADISATLVPTQASLAPITRNPLAPDQIAYCYPLSMRPVKEIRREKLALLEQRAIEERRVKNRTEFGGLINKSAAQIYQWLLLPGGDHAENSTRGIRDDTARAIEQSLGLPAGWMDMEEGALAPSSIHSYAQSDGATVTLPYLADYIEPGGAHGVALPRALLAMRLDLLEPHIRVAWKEGDDMRGQIEVGDLVFVDMSKSESPPRHAGVYAVRLGKQHLIQRISFLAGGGYRLQGSARDADTIDMFEDDLKSLRVFGRVVAKLSRPVSL